MDELMTARAERDKWRKRAKRFRDAYRELSVNVTALEFRLMHYEAYGAEKVHADTNRWLKDKMLEVCRERNALAEQLAALWPEEITVSEPS